mmetsp:Transcript_33126/g.39667  ORF Transcript_33126/g.39667 Transcript_33126/m.39667 type:complete len:88 (-) Transcript_33126:56-319(-)
MICRVPSIVGDRLVMELMRTPIVIRNESVRKLYIELESLFLICKTLFVRWLLIVGKLILIVTITQTGDVAVAVNFAGWKENKRTAGL